MLTHCASRAPSLLIMSKLPLQRAHKLAPIAAQHMPHEQARCISQCINQSSFYRGRDKFHYYPTQTSTGSKLCLALHANPSITQGQGALPGCHLMLHPIEGLMGFCTLIPAKMSLIAPRRSAPSQGSRSSHCLAPFLSILAQMSAV